MGKSGAAGARQDEAWLATRSRHLIDAAISAREHERLIDAPVGKGALDHGEDRTTRYFYTLDRCFLYEGKPLPIWGESWVESALSTGDLTELPFVSAAPTLVSPAIA